ncbi:MAG: hydroxymethylbilane synthase [Dehalococcoidia bacterium]|nr:hydroxymethylbilane synthase [Dehalococcoidia bacterium]
MSKHRIFIIGSRGSKLAVIQAKMVEAALLKVFPDLLIGFKTITTTGDRDRTRSLDEVGGQGIFVKELENALAAGQIDLAVHSLKDVPTELAAGLTLAGVLPREDPRDVLVTSTGVKLADLPAGSRLGTESRRRAAQLKKVRPDLMPCPIRGNIDTRLRKVQSGEVDGAILAAAALVRLGWAGRITEYLTVESFLPAVGQGAVGIEIRADDSESDKAVSAISDVKTMQAVTAERAFMRTLGGGCRAPIASMATVEEGQISIEGMVASMDYSRMIRERGAGPVQHAEAIGIALGRKVLEAGGEQIACEAGRLNVAKG